ncbi:MAG: dimethylarginine dimethylaminohydrolase family protein [Solirubrobacterales bacterium]
MSAVTESATAIKWGADSEVGPLRHALLCPPASFRWLATSAISQATLDSGARFDPDQAHDQHAQLVEILRSEDVHCHFLDPDPFLPYQVFTRDSSLSTPKGLIVTQPSQPWRRGEHAEVRRFASTAGIPVWRTVTAGSIEGGDFILIAPGCALIGAGEGRTTFAAAEQVAGWLRELGWEVRVEPFPSRYVHMDVLVCMVAEKLALVCEEVVSGGLLSWLREKGIEIVPVPTAEAMALSVNVLGLGNERVVSAAESANVNSSLRAAGMTVLEPELSAYTRGGGGPHCLTQALRREPGG